VKFGGDKLNGIVRIIDDGVKFGGDKLNGMVRIIGDGMNLAETN
jgi:hypothetical protein